METKNGKNNAKTEVGRSSIRNGNLQIALRMAIECREKQEKELGHFSDSSLVAGWKQNLEALKYGKLEIID